MKTNIVMLSIMLFLVSVGFASAQVTITPTNPSVVDLAFAPEISSLLARNVDTYIGRTSNYTGLAIGLGDPETIKWKVTITSSSALTPDMVDLDEVGWKDQTDNATVAYHYPFVAQGGSLVAFGSCDDNVSVIGHDNNCATLIGFSLVENDFFTNVDKLRFSATAPLGDYIVRYELIDTNGTVGITDDTLLNVPYEVSVTLHYLNIVSANPADVSPSFSPKISSELVRDTNAFIGRTITYTGNRIDTGIQWKVTVKGDSVLTSEMVHLDEVGWNDILNVPSTSVFHYPFVAQEDGSIVADGSCDTADAHNDSCTTDSFGLDSTDIGSGVLGDVFTNADKIKFSPNAPLGTYTIKYELMNTTSNLSLGNAYKFNVTVNSVSLGNQTDVTIDENVTEVVIPLGSSIEKIVANTTEADKDMNISLASLINATGEVTLANSFTLERATSTVKYTAEIPTGTTISGGSGWDGKINVPTVRNAASYSAPSGSADVVVDVGAGSEINFSAPVKITIGGQAGKNAAWARGTNTLTQISTICSDVNNPTNIDATTTRECHISSGSDLVIWTYHFTQFAAFTPSAPVTSSGSSGGGGGGGGGGAPYYNGLKTGSKTVDMYLGGTFGFEIKSKRYYATLVDVDVDTATVVIAQGATLTLNEGKSSSLDIDKNGKDDFYVRLESVKLTRPKSATFRFSIVSEDATGGGVSVVQDIKPTEAEPSAETDIEGLPDIELPAEETEPAEPVTNARNKIIGPLIAVLVVLVLVGGYYFIKKGKKPQKDTSNSEGEAN